MLLTRVNIDKNNRSLRGESEVKQKFLSTLLFLLSISIILPLSFVAKEKYSFQNSEVLFERKK